MIHAAKDGHPAPSLSCADIIAALYFSVMRVRPEEPDWPDRDRLVLSKGHACPVLYAALAERGYFPPSELATLRSLHSNLQGHPYSRKTKGVDATTGSLGNGVSVGLGIAMAARATKRDYFAYVITGDGELGEGIVWEAAMAASHMKAGNLIVFVDANHYQSGGKVEDISAVYPLAPKWEAFGWHTQGIDGHDLEQIVEAVEKAKGERERPSVIIAETKKGKGIPFMIGDNSWHKRVITDAEYAAAMEALKDEA